MPRRLRSSSPLSPRERALREECIQIRLRTAAVLSELSALGVEDVTLSDAWHLESFLRLHPGEHRAGDLADRLGITRHSVRTHLASLVRTGKILRLRYGVYAALPTGERTRPAKGTHAPKDAPPDALRARLQDILHRSKKARSVRQLLTLLKWPAKRAERLVTYLATLAREGHILQVKAGVYAARTAAAAETPPSRARVHALIARSAHAMTTEEIVAALQVPPHSRARVLMWLADLAIQGLVRRVQRGVYASLEAAKTTLTLPTLTAQIRAAIETGDRAMSADDVLLAAKVPLHQHTSATATITHLVNRGLVRRVRRGVYAPVDVTASARFPPRPRPLYHQLREAIDHGGRTMTTAEILKAARVPSARSKIASATLSALARRGHVRRVARGVYASLQVALVPAPPSMAASLVALLARHPEGLDVATMGARMHADDDELDEALRELLRAKRVRRVRRGVYVATG